MRKKLGFLFCVLIIASNPSVLLAQTSSPSASLRPTSSAQTTKNVVRNFKINLNEYSAFGSDCSQKQRGDANCDTQINEFDLSIWEIEFNTASSPKRSDFNNDGVVNILDYGIWRNTTFSQRTTSNEKYFSVIPDLTLAKLWQAMLIRNPDRLGWILNQVQDDILKKITVSAQEDLSGGGEINSSGTFISESGNSLVINTLSDGNTQQVNFNQNGNIASASFFDANGQSYAEVAFTNSGGTTITTESNGVPVTVSKTASGPVIENFRNPDGSLLAIKSWPSQASYDANEPPLAVTIPGQGNSREILNMQPNGDGIVEKLDSAGNILSRTQLRSNGTIVTEDLNNNLIVQSNTEAKFTNLSMKNNIGGQTQYMFYDGSLFAIVQTDGGTNAYIAKPLDQTGTSWSYETLVEGVKRAEKIVTNPIIEAKSNTPNPQTLIQYINTYKQASLPEDAVTFSEGFTSTAPAIANPVARANSILAISRTQPPSVLGIIKEAKAQQTGWTQTSSDPSIGEAKFSGPNGSEAVVSVRGAGGNGTADIKVDIWSGGNIVDSYTFEANRTSFESLGFAPGANGTSQPGTIRDDASLGGLFDAGRQGSVSVTNNNTGATGPGAISTGLPGSQPAAPAPVTPAAPAAETPSRNPNATATVTGQSCTGNCAAAYSTYQDYLKGRSSETESIESWAAGKNISSENLVNAQAIQAAQNAFISTVKDGLTQEQINTFDSLVRGERGGAAGLYDAAEKAGATPETLARAQSAAEAATAGRTGAMASGGAVPGIQQIQQRESQDRGGTSPSTPAAAAAAAPGIPTQSGFIAPGIWSGVTAMSQNPGWFTSEIKEGGPTGTTIAIQTHNPALGVSNWSNAQGTFTAQAGTLTSAIYTGGPTLAVNSTGSLVDVSAWGRSAFDERGNLKPEVAAAAPRATAEQVAQYQASQAIQGGATGAPQYDLNQEYCFLPGTLISTPSGQKAIETLKPGDKVYSYNEKTGQKQISDFEELDVNFVDEYLIINGKIKTTIYHPFFIVIPHSMRDPGIISLLKTVRADQLKLGDILQNEKGQPIPVYSLERITAPSTTVYNLNNVSPNNNFFAQNILVHNYSFDTTADGREDPNPGGEPYNPDGSYTDSWAETGGWNPDYFSAGDISSGNLGGTSGDTGDYSYEGSGKAAAGDAGSGWGDSGNQNTDVNTDPGDNADNGSSDGGDNGQQSGPSAEGGDGGNEGGDQGGQSDANSSGADSSGW